MSTAPHGCGPSRRDRIGVETPRRPTAADGVVVVDKPSGWTSHDVVARMRRLAGTRRVGHAGTLDPMATGVLVIGIGRATRLLTYITGADKEYLATIRLGISTTTDDAEGEVIGAVDASGVGHVELVTAMAALTGDIAQVPSAVSAIKVDGQRAYARVRAGEDVVLAARPVQVSVFELGGIRAEDSTLDVDVRVVCSSGTYVRALARDLGVALGVGGHLTRLRRTRVGGFGLGEARTVEALGATDPAVALTVMTPAQAAARVMELYEVDAAQAVALGHGRAIDGAAHGRVGAVDPDGQLLAVLEPSSEPGRWRPALVLINS